MISLRLGHQATGDRQHLLLAAAHRAGELAAPLGEAREEGEGLFDQRRDLAALLDVRAELQVLHHRHLREDQPAFRHQGDAAPHDDVAGPSGQHFAGEADVALLRRQHARDHAHRRRLAGAVGAQQRHDLARLDGERHVAHGGGAVIGEGEASRRRAGSHHAGSGCLR